MIYTYSLSLSINFYNIIVAHYLTVISNHL